MINFGYRSWKYTYRTYSYSTHTTKKMNGAEAFLKITWLVLIVEYLLLMITIHVPVWDSSDQNLIKHVFFIFFCFKSQKWLEMGNVSNPAAIKKWQNMSLIYFAILYVSECKGVFFEILNQWFIKLVVVLFFRDELIGQ